MIDTTIAILTSTTKPIMRTVQGKPMRGSSCSAITGKTMPPVAAPLADVEIAMVRFVVKYVETDAMVGQKMRPLPRP